MLQNALAAKHQLGRALSPRFPNVCVVDRSQLDLEFPKGLCDAGINIMTFALTGTQIQYRQIL